MKNNADHSTMLTFAKNAALIHGGVFVDKSNSYESYLEEVTKTYKKMLEIGVAPEQARMILPQSTMTNWVWTGSLLSFFEMYKLRSEGHAQKEAQDFAAMVRDVIAPLYPVSWAALEEHK